MWHTCAFDQFGLLRYADYHLPQFPRNVFDGVPIWELGSDPMHVERIRQDFSVSYCSRQPHTGYYSFRSPEDQSIVSCMVQYQGIDASVLVRWKRAPPVSVLTKNEQQVVRLAIQDLDNKRIAQVMDLSLSGVSYLWTQIKLKVGKDTEIGAVLHILDENMLDEP